MAINILSAIKVERAKPKDKEYQLSDGGGLSLRVRPTGARDWLFIFTAPSGKRLKMGLGSYPDTSLETARCQARNARGLLDQGINPLDQKRRAALEARTEGGIPRTVSELFERWMERVVVDGRKDQGSEMRRSFERDVLPAIGAQLLNDVRRVHISTVLENVLSRKSNRMANRLLSDMRQMFTYGVSRDFTAIDPTVGLRKRDFGGEEKQRERVMSEDEIRTLPSLLAASGLSEQAVCSIWITLATACRVGEISRARWEHVDLNNMTWFIPPENSKNGQGHLVHLSTFAHDQFKRLQAFSSSEWVLPSRNGQSHLDTKTLTKQIHDRQREAPLKGRSKASSSLLLPGGAWTPHDLRRTAATLMQYIGVAPHVIEKCLNHTEPEKLKKTYQRSEYLAERSSAFQLLGTRLALLSGTATNVVFLPRLAA